MVVVMASSWVAVMAALSAGKMVSEMAAETVVMKVA